jgi:hypothetical protein
MTILLNAVLVLFAVGLNPKTAPVVPAPYDDSYFAGGVCEHCTYFGSLPPPAACYAECPTETCADACGELVQWADGCCSSPTPPGCLMMITYKFNRLCWKCTCNPTTLVCYSTGQAIRTGSTAVWDCANY